MKLRFITAVCAALLAMTLTATISAGNMDKKFRKLIERYDLCDTVLSYPEGDAASGFWRLAASTDYGLLKFDKDISRKGGAQKEAFENLASTPKFYPSYSPAIDSTLQGYCDSLMTAIGADMAGVACRMFIVDSPVPELFFMLTDEGSAICVTSALYSNPVLTDDMLKALVVDEYVHALWRHPLQRYFKEARDKRKTRLWGSVAIAGLVVADAALAATTDYADNSDYHYTDIDVNVDVESHAKFVSPGFYFLDDQIYQADLIAYRFMERLGNGAALAEALKLLSASQPVSDDRQPSYTDRINFLKFVADNPLIGNEREFKRRMKEQEKQQMRNYYKNHH